MTGGEPAGRSTGRGRRDQRRPFVWAISAVVVLALVGGLVAAAVLARGERSRTTPGANPATQPVVADPSRPGVVPTAPPQAAAPASACPAPAGFSTAGVQVGLARIFSPGPVISFGLPLPLGTLADASVLRVTAGGEPVAATVSVLLSAYNAEGAPQGLRAVLIQMPASILRGGCAEVEVSWPGAPPTTVTAGAPGPLPYAAISADSDEVVMTATRTIKSQDGRAMLVESPPVRRVRFTGREPAVLATFPAGYLAATGILGPQVAASQLGSDLTGLKFIADQVTPFGLSAMYQESYALNPDALGDPDDSYEAWLYDRCATFLLFAASTGDTRFLREGLRSCSYYASKIALRGEHRGIFTGKPDPDTKYSHLRGLYAYYALTGDEAALAAGQAIAELWLRDELFATPYRAGQLRGPDKLWTERLLAVSLEGLYYGHLLTGDPAYLRATGELVTTAYRHIAGDAATLAALNPGSAVFPPQDCFVHNAAQAAEGNGDEPWCSGWMPALLIDPLLAYLDQTGDPRVDEIVIRLTRFLRDTGTSYFRGGLLGDNFLHPSVAYDPGADPDDLRILVPLYGAGVDRHGKRRQYGEYDDFQHCLDATAITAAGLRALRRSGGFDQHPIGPFASEGESFLALHQELAYCAAVTFADQTRPHRNPATFTSDDLAAGLRNPAKFIADYKIGHPSHNVAPERKLSWWFNAALAQFAILREAGIAVPALRPGAVQPAGATTRP